MDADAPPPAASTPDLEVPADTPGQGAEPRTTAGERRRRRHTPPEGAEVQETWAGPGGAVPYTCRAGWTVLAQEEEALAEVFTVSYLRDGADADRPVTFVFNGGPGASSTFLHLGALGPRRVRFTAEGRLLPAPSRLVDNAEAWLGFTDLVFVDPVGTGFSRVVPPEGAGASAGGGGGAGAAGGGAGGAGGGTGGGRGEQRSFYGVERDLSSLGEVVSRWLSANGRWSSPVFVAGESYGGFRAAKMVRLLPEQQGVGLAGALLISPALEIGVLAYGDYDVVSYIDVFPTMAATAFLHGRAAPSGAGADVASVLAEAQAFATGDYARFLVQGRAMPSAERESIMAAAAAMLGLDAERLLRAEGRIPPRTFARELLRDRGQVVAMYDGSYTADDPFPDRAGYEAPDPTLQGLLATYAAGINTRLRDEVGLSTDRIYDVLSLDVNKAWKVDPERHLFEGPVGATDDLRYGLHLQPHARVFLTHGLYDLVTPYASSDRLRDAMRLPAGAASRITTRHYAGGHMFYAWDASRIAFRDDVAAFYASALEGLG